jgi:hypothetical protein
MCDAQIASANLRFGGSGVKEQEHSNVSLGSAGTSPSFNRVAGILWALSVLAALTPVAATELQLAPWGLDFMIQDHRLWATIAQVAAMFVVAELWARPYRWRSENGKTAQRWIVAVAAVTLVLVLTQSTIKEAIIWRWGLGLRRSWASFLGGFAFAVMYLGISVTLALSAIRMGAPAIRRATERRWWLARPLWEVAVLLVLLPILSAALAHEFRDLDLFLGLVWRLPAPPIRVFWSAPIATGSCFLLLLWLLKSDVTWQRQPAMRVATFVGAAGAVCILCFALGGTIGSDLVSKWLFEQNLTGWWRAAAYGTISAIYVFTFLSALTGVGVLAAYTSGPPKPSSVRVRVQGPEGMALEIRVRGQGATVTTTSHDRQDNSLDSATRPERNE